MKQLKDIDLNLLIAFEVLMRECHVTRASVSLSVSQSTMSAALSKLRTIFADPLLVKAGHQLAPTEKALKLLPRVQNVLQLIDNIVQEDDTFSPTECTQTVNVVVIDYIDFVVMPRLMHELRIRAPQLKLRILGPNPRYLGDLLRSGQVDIFLAYFPELPEAVRTRPLFADRLVGICRKEHEALRLGMDSERFCKLPHISIEPGDGADMYNNLIDDALRAQGLSRSFLLSKPSFLGVPFMVADTDLVATLPERVARHFTKLVPIEMFDLPIESPQFTVSMIWHDRTHHSAVHSWLRDLILRVCQSL
jgi:DNA-binding transcriptional LysR family regulator